MRRFSVWIVLLGLALPADPARSAPNGCDFDGDGLADLVSTTPSATATRIWLGGPVGRPVGFVATLGWQLSGCGDFDGDGKDDLAFDGPNAMRIDLMNGTASVARGWIANGGGAFRIAAIRDVDGDGGDDLILAADDGTIRIDVLDGTSVVTQGWIAPSGTGHRFGAAGDLDADGDADVLRQSGGPGEIYGDAWLLDGAIATRDDGSFLAGDPEPLVAAADLEGAGFEAAVLDGAAFTRLATTGGWRFLGTGGGAWRVRLLADLDGDAQADLVSAATPEMSHVRVALLADTIAAPLGPVAKAIGWVDTGGGAFRLRQTGDFDGDGKDDLVYAGVNAVRIDLMDGIAVKERRFVAHSGDWSLPALR